MERMERDQVARLAGGGLVPAPWNPDQDTRFKASGASFNEPSRPSAAL